MAEVIWTKKAITQLERAVKPLLEFKKYDYRYLVVWSYKIVYRVTKQRITISRIFHTSQDPEKLKSLK